MPIAVKLSIMFLCLCLIVGLFLTPEFALLIITVILIVLIAASCVIVIEHYT